MFRFKYKKIDILSIGDIATDIFIKINEAKTKCDSNGGHCELCLKYGGKIPYESTETCYATGNSSNVSIATSRLGLKTVIMSNLGKDENGKECLKKLKEEKVDINFIKIEDEKPTNNHYVLWYGAERTILTKHENYNYIWDKSSDIKNSNSPDWIYLSSLGDNSLPFHHEILLYLKNHPEVKLAFSPGTFQIKLGLEKLKEIYQNTNIFICNHDEARKILKTDEKDIPKLMKQIYELGPKIVVLTDDVNGAYSYDGTDILFVKAFPTQTFIESTGAGDAFSGAFISALSLNKTISEALVWGAANAASVVSFVGPHKGLLTRKQIDEYIKNAPLEYKPIRVI